MTKPALRPLNDYEKLLVALCERWRSAGEFWSGTPEHAAFQCCADDLLQAMGLPDNARTLITREEEYTLLKSVGIVANLQDGRTNPTDAYETLWDDEKLGSLFRMLQDHEQGKKKSSDTAFGKAFRPHLQEIMDEIGKLRAQRATFMYAIMDMKKKGMLNVPVWGPVTHDIKYIDSVNKLVGTLKGTTLSKETTEALEDLPLPPPIIWLENTYPLWGQTAWIPDWGTKGIYRLSIQAGKGIPLYGEAVYLPEEKPDRPYFRENFSSEEAAKKALTVFIEEKSGLRWW